MSRHLKLHLSDTEKTFLLGALEQYGPKLPPWLTWAAHATITGNMTENAAQAVEQTLEQHAIPKPKSSIASESPKTKPAP